MTSLIPYHAEAEPTERFSFLSPSELSKLCHLDLYASLRPGDDPVAIRVLLHVIYPARSETQVGVNRAFSPPSPRTGIPLFYTPLSVPLFWISAREGIQNAPPIHATDNLAHPDTNGYRRPLLSRSLLFERRCLCSPDGTPVIGIFHNEPRGQPLSNESPRTKTEISLD